ncbi:hypothetical protein [Pseudanabaena sp. PCC 6802]|uniref:hypothetical protein n=1 Tax=Pseudanabaena sp. PCC 6802 TaxID=118173 RepID=UPI00034C6582|nr:hypothetical protein [Pseudanabaena sp. PCC 6802]
MQAIGSIPAKDKYLNVAEAKFPPIFIIFSKPKPLVLYDIILNKVLTDGNGFFHIEGLSHCGSPQLIERCGSICPAIAQGWRELKTLLYRTQLLANLV